VTGDAPNGDPNEGPVVRDRRRIDPDTGEVRDAGDAPGTAPAGAGGQPDAVPAPGADAASGADAVAAAKAEAAERLNDLKRLQAEYVNYRKRVERDRTVVRDNAVASVLGDLLGILDDIGRARDHGDLTGGFRSVGEALEAVTQKLGLVRYGEVGDEFDPTVHEALMHEYSDEVTTPTCTQVLTPGYKHGEKVLRAARVAVAEPTEALPDTDQGAQPEAGVDPSDDVGEDAATDAAPEAGGNDGSDQE
jgi:molecular chaperone GrpE